MLQVGFIFFLIVVSINAFLSFFNKNYRKYSLIFYWLSATPFIGFTAFRPWGIMRDDRAYNNIFNNLDLSHFDGGVLAARDPVWYFLVFLLKSVYEHVNVIAYLAAIVLVVKLYVLTRLCSKKSLNLVLLVYLCSFWQLHDLTQFRVSLSLAFFLFFLWSLVNSNKTLSYFWYLASVLAHNSAFFVAIFWAFFREKQDTRSISLSRLFLRSESKENGLSVIFYPRLGVSFLYFFVFLLFIEFGIFLSLADVMSLFVNSFSELASTQLGQLEMYGDRAASGNYDSYRSLPLILLLVVCLYFFMLLEFHKKGLNRRAFLGFISVIIATFLSWVFASISDVQVRFYEFFFVGALLLLGQVQNKLSFLAGVILAFAYYAKLNILWNVWDLSVL